MDAKKAAGPTWETVRYMVAAIQYGGRITDDLDQLLMDTYAARFFHQARPALLTWSLSPSIFHLNRRGETMQSCWLRIHLCA